MPPLQLRIGVEGAAAPPSLLVRVEGLAGPDGERRCADAVRTKGGMLLEHACRIFSKLVL